jgi:hypothetical protein
MSIFFVKEPIAGWPAISKRLLDEHPLKPKEIVEVVLKAWEDIFDSSFGPKPFKIGVDIFPKPQIMAFLLHELIPLEFSERYKGKWRVDKSGDEKDLVYISDDQYSVEIKTSSSDGKIFGNRSYAQKGKAAKKKKYGYYLAINFDKFGGKKRPEVNLIRFGWIDHDDWVGQAADTGQQAHLKPEAEKYKLIRIFPE